MLARTSGCTLHHYHPLLARTSLASSSLLPLSSCVISSSIISSLRCMATKSTKKVSKKATSPASRSSNDKTSSTATSRARATAVPSLPTPASSSSSPSSPSWLTAMSDIATSDRAAIATPAAGSGMIYMVATPIGNLADMTLRSIRILADVDLIVCEDTKVTATLLKRLNIPQKPLLSYNRRNWKTRLPTIVQHATTQTVAYVSDAGTPGICDPGAELAAMCNQHGIQVRSVPGACAAIAALSASGLQSFARETAGRQARALSKGVDSAIGGEAGTEFVFMGFIPETGRQRTAKLKLITSEHAQRTVVLYEAPHRLLKTLNGLIKADETADDTRHRAIYVAREITKIHEDSFRGTVADACTWYKKNSPRGEFTIVLGPVIKSSAATTVTSNNNDDTDSDTSSSSSSASSSDIDDALRSTPAGSRVAVDGIHAAPTKTVPISVADDERRRTIAASSSFGESRAYRDRSTTNRREALQVTIEEHVADVMMAKPDISVRDMADMVAKQLGIGRNTVYPTALYMHKQSMEPSSSTAANDDNDDVAAEESASDHHDMTDEEHRLDETLARVERLAQKLQSQRTDDDDEELDDVDALKSEDDDGSSSGEELSPEYHQLMEQVLAAASSVTPKRSSKSSSKKAAGIDSNDTASSSSSTDPVHIRELRAEAVHQLQPGYLQPPAQASSTPLPGAPSTRGRAAAGVTRRQHHGAGNNKRGQARHTVKQRKTPVTMKVRG